MFSRTGFVCLTVLALSSIPVIASAQDAPSSAWTVGGNAAVTTDYIFRGFSQTDEEPAMQGTLSLNHESGFAASLWGSNVDFNDGDEASVEMDATVSYTFPAGPGKFTLGGIYYAYPGADSSLDYDYIEGFGGYAFNIAEADRRCIQRVFQVRRIVLLDHLNTGAAVFGNLINICPFQQTHTDIQGEFGSNVRSEKKATYEPVREKVRREAQEKREEIPPQYRQESYEPEAPKESKMSGAFNRAGFGGNVDFNNEGGPALNL